MTLQVGDALPDFVLPCIRGEETVKCDRETLFGGKTAVVFALPGAYTPTCSASHVPGYVAQADALRTAGIDAIYCLSVNDPFVMKAWAKDQGALEAIQFLADGNAAFTKAIGMDVDMGALEFGVRSRRYAMLVEDGTITEMFAEGDPLEGDPFEVSDASTMLRHVQKVNAG
ncbi:MAG TPA: peroxiredoxin [Alphaproteobacteria bacterium]|nr:peroxiredoxin [Alphaproteobacteria bacterium]